MERIRDTPKKPETTNTLQGSLILPEKPNGPGVERPNLPLQLELPFITENGGESNGCPY